MFPLHTKVSHQRFWRHPSHFLITFIYAVFHASEIKNITFGTISVVPLSSSHIVTGSDGSHHFRFTKKWGLPVQGRIRPDTTGYPRASPGSLCPDTGIFFYFCPDTDSYVLLLCGSHLCSCLLQDPDPFLPEVDGCVHIPVLPVSARALVDPL